MPAALSYENVFRVAIVQFMDRFNFCVGGVKRSCIHFVTPNGQIIPFDTYNLFYRNGRDRRDPRCHEGGKPGMSTTGPPPPAPPQRKYLLGTGVLMFFGICFLLPGACSLYFIITLTIEKRGNPFSDPYVQIFAVVWVICFAIAALGVAMIVAARRRPRRSP